MTPQPSTTGATSSVIDLAAFLPLLVAVIGLAGLLVAAAWAARSAIMVRLLDANQQYAQRFGVFQQSTVAAMNELGLSMAHYAEHPADLAAAVNEAAARRPPGTKEITLTLDDAAAERVRVATDAWRLALAEAHGFADQKLDRALAAVDVQREAVVQHLNAKRYDEARDAVEQLREHQVRQAYRRLQIVGVRLQVGSIQLLRTRSLRGYLKRAEDHLQAELARGENLISDVEEARSIKGGETNAPD
jgi:hypothetical protein